MLSDGISPDVDFGEGVEIHKKPQLVSRGTEVIDQLRRMFCVKSFDGFEFEDDLVVADDVGHIEATISFLVENMQGLLGNERDAPQLQFLFKRVLIDLFKISWAKRIVNLKYCVPYGKGFVSIDVVAHGRKYTISVYSNVVWRLYHGYHR